MRAAGAREFEAAPLHKIDQVAIRMLINPAFGSQHCGCSKTDIRESRDFYSHKVIAYAAMKDGIPGSVTLTVFRIAIAAAITVCASCAPVEDAEAGDLQSALTAFENDEHGDLHSVIVIQNSEPVVEQYYNGGDRQTLLDVRSAGKSVTSLLFGIALDLGAIESLDDPVAKYLPAAEGHAIGPVRLADVLTMRSGLDADGNDPESPGYEVNMDKAEDPFSFAMAVPGAEQPGAQYRYNSVTAYIAGLVIGRAAGVGLEDFARDNLFEPLRIERWDWQEDRAGYTRGQGNLFLTAPGFARIGEMVLNGGAYDGRQVVSGAWIEESLKPRIDISDSDPFASGYGYYWYRQTYTINGRSIEVSFASGNGGNKIYVIPEFDMVVSIMSRAYGQGRGQRRSEDILKAILATQGAL